MSKEIKQTNIPWLPEMRSDFNLCRVKDVFNISKEKAKIKDPTILSLARDEIKVRDISSNEGQIAESYYDYNPVKPGDLLINPMDLYSGANCNVSNVEGVISPAYSNLRAKTQLNSKYFDYYFKYQYWTMAMFAHGKGVSFDNRWTLNADGLKNYEVPFPAPVEQDAIVKTIENKEIIITKLIKNEEKQIEKLKEYKQALITKVVTKGLDENVLMKDSGAGWIKSIPSTWSIVPLKLIFTFKKGLPITKENLIDEGLPVISYGQIHAKSNSGTEIVEDLIRYVSENYLESNPDSLASIYDFLVADTSEDLDGCGNCVFVDKEMILFGGYHTIILHSKKIDFRNKYLAYLFKTNIWRNQIRSRVSGVKLFSISRKILESCSVLVPPEKEREEIIEYLDKICSNIDHIIDSKMKKIERLKLYKKSLIYEYVTGKKAAY